MARKTKTTKKELKKGPWEADELRAMRKGFGSMSTSEMAAILGRPVENVKKKASRMRLYKTKAYLATLGRTR